MQRPSELKTAITQKLKSLELPRSVLPDYELLFNRNLVGVFNARK